MHFLDYVESAKGNGKAATIAPETDDPAAFAKLSREETYMSKDVDNAFKKVRPPSASFSCLIYATYDG